MVVGLEARGIEVTVCASSPSADKYLYNDRLDQWSGRIVFTKDFRFKFLFNLLASKFFWRILIKAIAKHRSFRKALSISFRASHYNFNRPEVIHFAFSGIAAEQFEVVEFLTDSKLFMSCRGSSEIIRPLIDSSRVKKLEAVIPLMIRVHCVSENMMATMLKYGLDSTKGFVNYPSIDLLRFDSGFRQNNVIQRDYSNPLRILSTGRLHYQKGYVYAIAAVRSLLDQGYHLHYDICGSGPEEGLVRFMIQQFNLDSVITLHGKVSSSQVKALLEVADVFLLSSIYEGIANAALEAMASGVPLVTTSAGGMDEVIDNYSNGIIVNPFSSNEIADGLSYIYNHPIESEAMARLALDKVKSHFSLDRQIDVFIQEYQAVV